MRNWERGTGREELTCRQCKLMWHNLDTADANVIVGTSAISTGLLPTAQAY